MPTLSIKLNSMLLLFTCCCAPLLAMADASSARSVMEDPGNPLMLISTSRGDIFLEMLRQEAPNNVQHFMSLAAGEIEILDAMTNTGLRPRYYDGMRFHRVILGFIIQAGSPAYHSLGAPGTALADEINADALGLNRANVINPDGTFNPLLDIGSKAEFDADILRPLYRNLGIDSVTELVARQEEVLRTLQSMTVKTAYENQGFRYRSAAPTRPISRGVIALANQGPNTNGAEFFISLTDAQWLSGKYTVIGRVVEGMEVVDAIGAQAVDPLRFSIQSSVIYSVTNIK
ncbi:MAG: peptidylprolyl isomerase [Gammaproteobacteria bacterium]|nr:peptidylprolyl isomerase [Gammaproteobacteria bacterium]